MLAVILKRRQHARGVTMFPDGINSGGVSPIWKVPMIRWEPDGKLNKLDNYYMLWLSSTPVRWFSKFQMSPQNGRFFFTNDHEEERRFVVSHGTNHRLHKHLQWTLGQFAPLCLQWGAATWNTSLHETPLDECPNTTQTRVNFEISQTSNDSNCGFRWWQPEIRRFWKPVEMVD